MIDKSRHQIIIDVEKRLRPRSAAYVAAAFEGDEASAAKLAASLSWHESSLVAYSMCRAKTPPPALRSFLDVIWAEGRFLSVSGEVNADQVADILRYAAFPPPHHLPKTLQVWRGYRGTTVREVSQGYSWTLDRDVACWFAFYGSGTLAGTPMVITARVNRQDIAYYTNKLYEEEVVILETPRYASIDGTIDDWFSGMVKRQSWLDQVHRGCFTPGVTPAA